MTDREWLLQRRGRLSDGQIEAFCERVAIILEAWDGDCLYWKNAEARARRVALIELDNGVG